MKTALLDLFTSKKFLAALSAIVIYLAGRFGFQLDPATLDRIFAALLVYVGAQGVADVGKSAALIRAAAPANDNASPTASATVTLAPVAGMLLVVLAGGLALQPACSSWRARTVAGTSAFIDCESPHIDAQMLADATALGKAAVLAAISGDGHADAARLKADAAPLKSDLLRCGFAAAIAALATPTPAQPGAPAAAGLEVDGPQLRGAFATASAELGWGPVHLPGGAVL